MNKYTPNFAKLQGYVITADRSSYSRLLFNARPKAKSASCKFCKHLSFKVYEFKIRRVLHSFWDSRPCSLRVKQRRFKCLACKKRFWEQLPDILQYQRRTESLRKQIALDALAGHSNKYVSSRYSIGQATVQRDVNHFTFVRNKEKSNNPCPKVLGIDEHFFSRKKGFATTLCDLVRRKVFNVVLGRSEASLERYLTSLKHKSRTKVIVMDLSSTYRSIAKKYFPNAMIVADRFHVIRLINQKFLDAWKEIDPIKRANIGLVSLFRRKPSNLKPHQALNLRAYLKTRPMLELMYDFRNRLHALLMQRGLSEKDTRESIVEYLKAIQYLRETKFKSLNILADTLESWQEEILRMLRFSRSNAVTEGFHNKMEKISRAAYGYRNFNNYKQRVLLQCG